MQANTSPRRGARLVISTPNFDAEILAGGPVVARVTGRGALAAIELPPLSVAGPRELAELLASLETILGALRGRGVRNLVAAALAAALDPASAGPQDH